LLRFANAYEKVYMKGVFIMRKLICIILAAAMVLTPSSMALAKQSNNNKDKQTQNQEQQVKESEEQQVQIQSNTRIKEKKSSFKINGAPVVKYGRYKIPISPITKGMGATVSYDKTTAVLTIKKDVTTIVIDFKNKVATVNGIADTDSGIFTAKNDKKMSVLVKYVAEVLGVRVSVGKDKITVTVPGLDFPTKVTITPEGGTVVANALNTTNLSMSAMATIKAGQATGGKAELYVGSKLITTDTTIAEKDTTVTFTTSDGTPTNAELQALVSAGGVVTVKLYNASNQGVTSVKANPTLAVDYVLPTITSVTGATLSVSGSAVTLAITGGSQGDKVDVSKISFYDTALAKTYQLTNAAETGSVGIVTNANTIVITLGLTDREGLAGFGNSTVIMYLAAGPLLQDAAGNVSVAQAAQTVPVTVIP